MMTLVRCSLVVLLFGAAACSRQPCGEEDDPRVRLDVALETCNFAPVALISTRPEAGKRATVKLDGSESSDKNGDSLAYRWSLVSVPEGSAARLDADSGMSAQFLTDLSGAYEVELVVSDGELESEPARRTIRAKNRPPVAAAGNDVAIDPGARATLDGSGSSDPDEEPLSFSWTIITRPEGSTAQLEGADTARPELLGDVRGAFVARLRVSDGEEEAEDTVRIGVGISGGAPVANAGADREVRTLETVTLDGSRSSDPDGDSLSYTWRLTRPPSSMAQLSSTTGAQVTFVPDTGGAYVAELVVNDGFYDSPAARVTITAVRNPIGQSVFDPNRVYLFGTLEEGVAGRDVVCDLATPNLLTAGFEATSSGVLIRADGALLYRIFRQNRGELHRFVADRLTYDSEGDRWEYPANPIANDPLVATPGCTDVALAFAHPLTGELTVYCGSRGGSWLQPDGRPLDNCSTFGEPNLAAIGVDGSVLCIDTLRDASGVGHRLSERLDRLLAARARPEGGFWVVMPTQEAGLERWVVEGEGTVRFDLAYPAVPPPYRLTYGLQLDGAGNLYVAVSSTETIGEESVMRFDGSSPPVIVYSEATDPSCKMHGSRLVTGP